MLARIRILAVSLSLWLWISCASPVAQAHDGPARLELHATRLNPGAPLDVRGVNVAAEQPIHLVLVGMGGEFFLGAAFGDEHGDFSQAFELPAGVPAGEYTVEARSLDGFVVAAPLTIAGQAVSGGEQEGGLRDQGESLLIPLPPGWNNPTAQPATADAPAASPAPISTSPPSSRGLSWFASGVVVLSALGFAIALRRRAPAG